MGVGKMGVTISWDGVRIEFGRIFPHLQAFTTVKHSYRGLNQKSQGILGF